MTKKIPDFKTMEEAAEYWDTHSFADHIEETEPVEIKEFGDGKAAQRIVK